MAGLGKFSFEVFGKVQGVFFRKYTKKEAEKLGLCGWVMNTPTGTVVGEVQGALTALATMKHWLGHTGSPKSKIEKLVVKNEVRIKELECKGFEIRKDPSDAGGEG
eukprot:jgi/Mesvir1/13143/Mv06112-RA.1